MKTNRHFHERCNVMPTEIIPQWSQVLHVQTKNQISSKFQPVI